jgi:phosphoserine phosphatase
VGRGDPDGHREPFLKPASPPPWPLVTVDIDGTLTTVHGWQVIADALGRRDEFDATQRRFFAKEVGEDEHLAAMLRIARGRHVDEVEAALESTPRLDGIGDGVRRLHDAGSRVALLTHNPSYVGDWYVRRFGFDDFEGVATPPVRDGEIGTVGTVRADKLTGLARLTERAGTTAPLVVHVGDGWADAALFPKVGRGVALNSRLPEVERAADLVLRTRDFREVAERIERLRSRP